MGDEEALPLQLLISLAFIFRPVAQSPGSQSPGSQSGCFATLPVVFSVEFCAGSDRVSDDLSG